MGKFNNDFVSLEGPEIIKHDAEPFCFSDTGIAALTKPSVIVSWALVVGQQGTNIPLLFWIVTKS